MGILYNIHKGKELSMVPVINLDTEEKEIDRRIEIGVETFEEMQFTTWFESEQLISVLERYIVKLDQEEALTRANKLFKEAIKGEKR